MIKEQEEVLEEDLGVIEDDDLDNEIEDEAQEVEEVEEEEQDESGDDESEEIEDAEENEESEVEEVSISIEGEEPEPETDNKDPKLVKHLRQEHKRLRKEIRELKAKQSTPQAQEEEIVVGEKPTLADYDYDEEKFGVGLVEWNGRKSAVEKKKAQAQERQLEEQKAWQEKLDNYNEKKKALPVKDFEDSESEVLERLSVAQQSVILQVAKSPESLVYALGKAPKRLEELAKITDPVTLAYELARIESNVKMVAKKKTPPKPERKVSGSASPSANSDSQLEKLRAKAEKTGDFTKVFAYKQKLKQKQG